MKYFKLYILVTVDFAMMIFRQFLQWNPVNTVTNGPKKIGRNNEVTVLTRVSFQEIYGRFCRAAKKSGRNNEVTVLPRWS